ncbi:MBL fold metallo-hydrolase [Jatrophihabitans sp.]|uniref:MBL fold metallo-hydrolase n=1 Tax=Jatrophihabitans sp. TaxID=1932789 RepID=UPI0030C74BE1|nr:Metallo-beta-lactamase superfamily protein [Jatrophihabitans sp.]
MKVHHLNCATMRPPGGRLISGTGTIGGALLVAHCLLIETDAGLVLVDTGLGLEDVAAPKSLPVIFRTAVRPKLDRAETAAAQVEALGFAREDVRHIITTHLDVDHAGGLRDFPDATVHVSAAELAAARNPRTRLEKDRYVAHQWAHGPKWAEHAVSGGSWKGFEAVTDLPGLPPEILLVPLAGHTRGHSGIAVDTGDGWLLHAGDAYFFHGQLRRPPTCPPGLKAFQVIVQTEKAKRLANVARLNELATDPAVSIFSAHDRHEFDQLKAVTR